MSTLNRRQRIIMGALTLLVIVVQLFAQVAPVNAQGGATTVIADIPARVESIAEKAGKALYASALSALVNGTALFMKKLAYDSAVAISTGGKGQSALFIRNPGKYFKDSGDAVLGEAISTLGDELGVDLCKIPDLRIQVYLKLGFRRLYTEDGSGPKPKCTLSQITSNFSKFKEQYTGDQLLSRFSADVKVEESDLGVSLGYLAKLDRVESEKKETNIAEYLANRGFKPITDLISGNVKTPAAVIEEETKALGPGRQADRSLNQINGIYGAGAAQILPVAASVFLNTLTGQLLDKALKRGMFANGTDVIDGGSSNNFYGGTFTDNRRAAEQAFSFLFTAIPTKQLNAYDIVSEFASCPDNPGLNNCVVDSQMQKLIDLSRTEGSVTIGEAIERGFLNPELPLISPLREFQHTNIHCYQEGYCYSNIQKLRKVRILPLGFEIAALNSDPDVPWKLGEVVKNFETCERDAAGNAIPDPRRPFCHLIDPNWIIKAPEARCEAKVNGSERADDSSPLRKQECVDVSTCILEGANGECLGTYGYCTKEQNVWRMAGESCQAQFATCKTYTGSNGAVSSYLSRTLDYGACTADNVGCRAYSLEQAGGSWVYSTKDIDNPRTEQLQKGGRGQTVYLNGKVDNQSCSANDEGCSAFTPAVKNQTGAYQRASGEPLYLKKAPAYLGCYDTNATTAAIDWPKNKTELLTGLNKDAQCDKFAQACIAEEVGCDGFTPKNGGPMIPGIVGNNSCSRSCVGYDAYKQEASSFDVETYPVYLIPNTTDPEVHALSCPTKFIGCDEFTNLETSAQGGESLEYYTDLTYCEKPNGNNQKTYYSWEGDRNQGFVLRVHRLLQVNSEVNKYVTDLDLGFEDDFSVGSPSYQDMTPTALTDAVESCNQNAYELLLEGPDPATGQLKDGAADADCRALYDDEGEIYYRLLENTVTVSDQCKRLRKTDTVLEVATQYLNNEDACSRRGGFWQGNSCQVCKNGGRYEGGACVYQTIPSEATSCRGPANNPAQYKGCRLYTGKDANNTARIFLDEFEPAGESPDARIAAQGQWTGGVLADEATQALHHSLAVDNGVIKRTINTTADTLPMKRGERYELTFWARGVPSNLHVEFHGGGQIDELTADGAVSVGNVWQRYQVSGLISNIVSPENGVELWIRSDRPAQEKSTYFVDSILLRRINSAIPLVKNSWAIPTTCDSNSGDGLPGMALGCSEYKNSADKPVYATGFDKLCRAEAIGCQPMYDTFNTNKQGTSPEQAHAYNVWCEADPGEECHVTVSGVQSAERCTVKPGERGCFIDSIVLATAAVGVNPLSNDNIKPATVFVPADTPVNDPIFLTVRDEFTCQSDKKGCQKVGLEEQRLPGETATSYAHTSMFVRNDPDLYTGTNGILCRADLVGCGEFKSGSTVSYFKDPVVTGNSLCEYKDFIPTKFEYGWVLKDIGQCSNNEDKACRVNSDCVTPQDQTATCKNIGAVSCYNNNISRSGEQGIWSNKSDGYLGMVGTCPAEANQCTELVDVQATANAASEANNKYYVIYDSKITARVDECNGQVSLKEGCVLFDKTDNPNKIYNSDATYQASGRIQDAFVSPETTDGPFDSNVILKVDRDRMCSEWLACKSSIVHTDERGVKTNLCYQYKTCKGTRPGVECTDWVDDSDVSGPSDQFLSQEQYVGRATNWNSEDYSGYSLFNKYQINNLVYLRFDFSQPPYEKLAQEGYDATTYAAYEAGARFFEAPPAGSRNVPDYSAMGCQTNSRGVTKKDWDICGFDNNGRCYGGKCVYPTDGQFPASVNASVDGVRMALQTLGGGTCKGYPEDTSPFSSELVLEKNKTPKTYINPHNEQLGVRFEYVERARPFEGVNVCQGSSCSCEYKKVTYKNGETDYMTLRPLTKDNVTEPTNFQGICVGGDVDGAPCNSKDECRAIDGNGENGECSAQAQTQTHFGLQGYCLEKDFSRPFNTEKKDFACLTWLPIQVSASGIDLYNMHTDAGYNPTGTNGQNADATANAGQTYCLATTQANKQPYDPAKFIDDESLGFGTFFANNGMPRAAASGQCSEHPASSDAYELAVCADTGSVPENLYTAMQQWAWNDNGLAKKNAVVLRVEHAPYGIIRADNVSGDRSVYRTMYGYGSKYRAVVTGSGDMRDDRSISLTPDCKDCYVYHFAPVPLNIGYENDGKGRVPTHAFGYGTIMHPPRVWNEAGDYAYSYNQTDNTAQIDGGGLRRMYTLAMAPGGDLNTDGYFANQFLYRSGYESKLLEDVVQSIYFVPTAFPYGAEGYNIPLLSREAAINFSELRKDGGARSQVQSISAFDGGRTGIFLPTSRGVINKGVVWTYMLDGELPQGSEGSLSSFANYTDTNRQTFGSLSTNAEDRNKIRHRYVMVFAGGDSVVDFPSFIPRNGSSLATGGLPGFGGDADPFTARCEPQTENWLAIGMDFNYSGQFLGYISRWCNGTDSGDEADNGVQFAVIATINNQCSTFATVYDASSPLQTNKAWTQRVWEYGGQVNHPMQTYSSWLQRVTNFKPFGSVPISSADVRNSERSNGLITGNGFSAGVTFRDFVKDGIPYSCLGGVPYGLRIMGSNGSACINGIGRAAATQFDGLKDRTFEEAKTALHQLYQKFYEIWDVALNRDGETGEEDTSGDQNNLGETVPPQIYSLNPAKCFTVAGARGTDCIPGEKNNITVSGKNGTMTNYDEDPSRRADEDTDGDGAPDPIIQTGSYVAIVKFFAFADDNRMPIRRVLVEWGDNSQPSGEKLGLFKNSKPFCEIGDKPTVTATGRYAGSTGVCVDNATGNPTGVTCKGMCPSDQTCRADRTGLQNGYDFPRFGDMARSCTDTPFEFVHTYTCGPTELEVAGKRVDSFSENIKNRLIAQGLPEDARVCSFTPRAQVLDNWGYCNGDRPQGYYNDGGDKLCDRKEQRYYAPFKGQIIVIPTQR